MKDGGRWGGFHRLEELSLLLIWIIWSLQSDNSINERREPGLISTSAGGMMNGGNKATRSVWWIHRRIITSWSRFLPIWASSITVYCEGQKATSTTAAVWNRAERRVTKPNCWRFTTRQAKHTDTHTQSCWARFHAVCYVHIHEYTRMM